MRLPESVRHIETHTGKYNTQWHTHRHFLPVALAEEVVEAEGTKKGAYDDGHRNQNHGADACCFSAEGGGGGLV